MPADVRSANVFMGPDGPAKLARLQLEALGSLFHPSAWQGVRADRLAKGLVPWSVSEKITG